MSDDVYLWCAPFKRILADTADVGCDIVFDFGRIDGDDLFDRMDPPLINVFERNQSIPVVDAFLPRRIISKSPMTACVFCTDDVADIVCTRPVFFPSAPFGIGTEIRFVHKKRQRIDGIDVVCDTFVNPYLAGTLRG